MAREGIGTPFCCSLGLMLPMAQVEGRLLHPPSSLKERERERREGWSKQAAPAWTKCLKLDSTIPKIPDDRLVNYPSHCLPAFPPLGASFWMTGPDI